MKLAIGKATMKPLAIFSIGVGILLACFVLFVRAQDETPLNDVSTDYTAEAPALDAQMAPGLQSDAPAPVTADQTEVVPISAEGVDAGAAVESPVVPAAVAPEGPVVTESAPSAAVPPVAAEVVVPDAAIESPVVPAAVAPEVPVAPESAPSAAVPPVAAEVVVTDAAIESPVVPAAVAPAAVEMPQGSAPVVEKESVFELDRGSQGMLPEGSAVVKDKSAEVAEVEVNPQPKPSFWGRLFGRKKTVDTQVPVTDAPSEPAVADGGLPTEPAVAHTNIAETKTLTPEEVVAAQEEVRRQVKEVEALKFLDLAYQAMGRNDFETALKYFNQAMNAMPSRPHTVETRQKAMQSQAECEYRIALNYSQVGKYQEAQDAIRRALGYYPAHQKAARLSQQIKKDENRASEVAAIPVPPRHAEDHVSRVNQIKSSFDLGRQYYNIGEYEQARREFKNVLVLDEKNADAAAWLNKVFEKMYNLETDQMNRQQLEMMAQVRDAWTPPVKHEVVGRGAQVQETNVTDAGRRRMQEKLTRIVIPELNFEDATIYSVIKFLDQASIAADKDSAPGDKGVNFIIQLKRPDAAGATAPNVIAPTPEGELVSEGATIAMPGALKVPGMHLRSITLIDALKYVTEVTGLKYRVEENAVVITPIDMPYGDLVTRQYKVQPSIAETIMGAAGGSGGGGAALDDNLLSGPSQTVERSDVKKFFVSAGVPFPEGTSIVYKPSLNLLIVKNTADNLETFEHILNFLNVVPPQVEIEARFVEVGQQDMEELGVEWLLTDNWELAENASAGAMAPLASRERIQVNQNTMSKGLRNLAQTASGIATTPGGNMAGILSISSILTNPEMTMILHALEQRSGANLLSAPKVTTKSSQSAEIKVVEILRYPTDFELVTPQASGSTQTGSVESQAFLRPTGFEEKELGVSLQVSPTVGPDGTSIDLVMTPAVTELVEWVNYGYTINYADGRQQDMPMHQPIFKTRQISTGITIWDGQTVVMGGLITEKQSTTLDKIPLLGDIPLLGFLFQSKTSNSKKYNLLIFVTANLVDPAGNKIHKEPIGSAVSAVNVSPTTP